MASPTQWTWVWVDSGSWWWTWRPGMLRFMGLQSQTRLSDWTELNWTDLLQYSWASFVTQWVKKLPAVRETWVQFLCWKDTLEKGKATHSSILTWKIPWTVDTTEWFSLSKLFEVHVTDKKWMFFRCTMSCFDVCIHCEMITTVNLINISITLYSYDFYLCGENT